MNEEKSLTTVKQSENQPGDAAAGAGDTIWRMWQGKYAMRRMDAFARILDFLKKRATP